MFIGIPKSKKAVLCTLVVALYCLTVNAVDKPFYITDGLFDQSKTDDLGLSVAEGTQTYTIFSPTTETDKFSNGVVLIGFKSKLYCMWQSASKDEDAADTWVAYSTSSDGITWTNPDTIIAPIDSGYCSSGGWWATEDTLVAYINLWPSRISPRGGYTYFKTSIDGANWSDIKPVLMEDGSILNGIFEQDPHTLPNGRIINAAHFQPGINICPIYTDDALGVKGWKKGDFTGLEPGDVSREIEPSWFRKSDGTAVMIFRDQNSTFWKLASVSTDKGESWTRAVSTNMPDARTKQSAGNLPDGKAFMAGNPVNNKLRIPLAVTLSENGTEFNTSYLLRAGGDSIPTLRYEGKAKRSGYHYPKSVVWNGFLCVSYATNKEDVEYTRVPLSSLVLSTSFVADQNKEEFANINMHNKVLTIQIQENDEPCELTIYSVSGEKIYSSNVSATHKIDMSQNSSGIYLIDIVNSSDRLSKKIIL